ncbi:MAG: hypothetical protein HGGPFJEG_00307 [Ignavibacteria bacterium]|nr:hypothetical protein [Ignavibacteria bacterium]
MTDNHDIKKLLDEINYFHEVTNRISEKKPLDILLNEIMESCKELMTAEASSLLMYDEVENILWFEIATGEKGKEVKKVKCNMGEGIAGWVAENRTPLLIDDCYNDYRFNKEFDMKSRFRTHTMICAPMIHKDKLIGVIQVINKKTEPVFSDRDFNLFNLLASQCAIAIDNARLIEVQVRQEALNRELKTASAIQKNLLPDKLPDFKDIEVYATIIPAKQVGGDFYNVYKLNDNQTLVIVTDVSGKSISASLIVSTICSAIITYFKLKNDNFELNEFVDCLNKVLIDSTTSDKFATAWFGLISHNDKKLKSINAGHNAIFHFKRNGELTELKEGGLFLGITEMEYKEETLSLSKDDLIYFYTDGVTEAMNSAQELYTDERAIKLIRNNFSSEPKIIIDRLISDIKSFAGDAEQSDDITCGIIKVL